MDGISQNNCGIELRAYREEDDAFLFDLFVSARAEQFAPLNLDPAQLEALLRVQFLAQTQGYAASYSHATHAIIYQDAQRIGRILTQENDDEIVLVDIAILPQWRNHGIGTTLLRNLQTTATAKNKPVRLSVAKNNRALGLYRRLGFMTDADTGVHLTMTWPGVFLL